MERKSGNKDKPGADRESRLKAALKANLARRKAQAKARQAQDSARSAQDSSKE